MHEGNFTTCSLNVHVHTHRCMHGCARYTYTLECAVTPDESPFSKSSKQCVISSCKYSSGKIIFDFVLFGKDENCKGKNILAGEKGKRE